MNNNKKTIGYFVAKICDLESAESATTPPRDISLSFYFTIEPELNIVRVLKAFLDLGCFPVALLWRDLRTHELSVGYPGSIPAWLRTVVSNRAPDLINDIASRLTDDYNEDSGKWC